MNQSVRPHLRELRDSRGWTQQDVVDGLCRLARIRGQQDLGVDVSMVSKWERGAKGVSRRYRVLLAALFGVPVTDLWHAGPGALRLEAAHGNVDERSDPSRTADLLNIVAELARNLDHRQLLDAAAVILLREAQERGAGPWPALSGLASRARQ